MDHEHAVRSAPDVQLNHVHAQRDRRLERGEGVSWGVPGGTAMRDNEGQGGATGHPDRMNVRDPPVRPAADREDLL